MRTKLLKLCSALMMATLSAPAPALDHVTVLTWEEFISPRVIKTLRNAENLDVKVIEFSTSDQREQLLAKFGKEIDIIGADTVAMPAFKQRNLLAKIDGKRIPALKVMQAKWKTDTTYSVPYLWGYTGIAWRTDKVKQPITSFAQLVALAKSNPGKVALIDDTNEAMRAAHAVNGGSADFLRNPQNIAVAQKELSPLLGTMRIVGSELDDKSPWLDGSLIAGQAYNGDIAFLRDNFKAPLAFYVPSPGCTVWQERMAILASSKNKDAAYRFLDLITSLKYAARNSMDVRYAPANPMAIAGLSEEFLNDPVIRPNFDGLAGCYVLEPQDAATTAAVEKISLKGVEK